MVLINYKRATLLLSLRAALSSAEQDARRVLLLRHGETNFNNVGRIQGTLESELTEKGRSQARAVGTWLSSCGVHIDQVLCSPKVRTMATLDEIESAFAHAGKPPLPQRLVRADLREIELTHWEGQYRKDIQQSDAAAWLHWKTEPTTFVFPTGHAPLPHLWGRTRTEWAHLREITSPGTTTLVVAHGAFNRAFLARVFGLPMDTFVDEGGRFAFDNCECVEIEWFESGSPDSLPSIRWRRRHPHSGEWASREDEERVPSRAPAGRGDGVVKDEP